MTESFWAKHHAKDENGNTLLFIHFAMNENHRFTGEMESNIPPYLFLLEVVKEQLKILETVPGREEIEKIGAIILNAVIERPELGDIILSTRYLNKDGSVNTDLYADEKMRTGTYGLNYAYTINEDSTAFEDVRRIVYEVIGYPWTDETKCDREKFESMLQTEQQQAAYAEIFENDLDYHSVASASDPEKSGSIWAGKDHQMLFVMIWRFDAD